jgi:hypothetical protein
MKTITVQQPWAECIAAGAKRVENRTRPFRHRGPLAIHASRTWSRHGGNSDLVIRALAGPLPIGPITEQVGTRVLAITTGAVIAVADLADCHPDQGCCRPWGEPGVYHLALDRVRRLPRPVPARGALGLWNIDLPDPREVAR